MKKLILIAAIFFPYPIYLGISTHLLVQGEAYRVLVTRKIEPKTDRWGNELLYTVIETEDEFVITVKSTKWGISATERDLNKSGIVGEWAGKKTRKFVPRFWRGMTHND